MEDTFDICKFLSLDGYDTQTRRARRKSPEANTQEFFTPYSIVKRMADKIPEEDWADPSKTFLEPCAGNGQFVCYIIYRRVSAGIDPTTAFKTCYATELMEDNVLEMKQRCIGLLKQMQVQFDEARIRSVMEHNFVCTDFFNWDYKLWKPIRKPLF